MKGYVCKVCGFVSIDGSIPDKCPACGSPSKAFEEKMDAIKTAKDEEKLSEKHTPVITVVRKCGLIPEGCADVHVRIGSVIHPMLPEHYITAIDFYIDNKFLARTILTPEKLNPAAALHLKVATGKLSVVEHCNIHGNWIAEQNL
ncbi:MAG: desulfoferrodoxin family protein [Candidatus Omnitrophica bacterium]|nr:desulfoferrodoxin family protein [Candidatus Omnitrophota bacterium]HOX54265.1 desulfoferrodoxin family protein [Candidatus Omnitrophota bacterium]